MARRVRSRQGMATIMVLVLMSIALAVSYSMLRNQATTAKVTDNLSRTVDARQAAITGMNTALRVIHDEDWEGVDSDLGRWLNQHEWFQVSFETGDASLHEDHPDRHEYPFRVTIVSTGYAVDPADSNVRAEHTVKAVVQLVRRRLSETPSNWDDLQNYTVYQWANKNVYVQPPVRIEGPVRQTGRLYLSHEYPDDDSARERYLSDLQRMNLDGIGDFRPYTGPLDLRYRRNKRSTLTLLRSTLGLETHDFSASTSAPMTHPGTVLTYRLYPGGKEYEIPRIQSVYGSTLSNIHLKPDPVTNPLGVVRSYRDLYLQDNVSIQGTVLCYGSQADIQIYGDNVHLEPATLPAMVDSSDTIQMPTALVRDDLCVHEESQGGSLTGLAVTWDDFEFRRGDADVSFDVQGRVLARELKLRGRRSWDLSDDDWEDLLDEFLDQLDDESTTTISYFPQWVQQHRGLSTEPLLTIKPQSGEVTYHWPNWDEPVFVPHPDDDGLRWEVVRWNDK